MIPKEVIEVNAGLIWKIAKNFYGVDKQDLFQAGALGVAKAYHNYKKNGQTKFSTYAYDYIFGEMYALAQNKNIKISKDILKKYKIVERTKYLLAQKFMRIPTDKEIASYLEISIDDLKMIKASANYVISLDDNSEESRNLHETIALEDKVSQDDLIMLNNSIEQLNPMEQSIINSRYYQDLTQSETAEKLGISQVKVSRYEKKSLVKIREYMK